MMPLLKMPTTTATPATGAIVTLPRYTTACPERVEIYMALMAKGRLAWDDLDCFDWYLATGNNVAPIGKTIVGAWKCL